MNWRRYHARVLDLIDADLANLEDLAAWGSLRLSTRHVTRILPGDVTQPEHDPGRTDKVDVADAPTAPTPSVLPGAAR